MKIEHKIERAKELMRQYPNILEIERDRLYDKIESEISDPDDDFEFSNHPDHARMVELSWTILTLQSI